MEEKKEIFTKEKLVSREDIDELNHVNNIKYLEWVLEISDLHWTKIASSEIRKQVKWVVLNHFIEYKNPAFEGEKLSLTTGVSEVHGATSERWVEIVRLKDQKTIVKAKSLWCLVDAQTMRPKRVSEEIKNIFLNN